MPPLLLTIFALAGATLSCSDAIGPTGEVASVQFSRDVVANLLPGQTTKLTPLPLNAAGQVLDIVCVRTFRSDNQAVATVDQQGTVTAIAPGIATVTATLNNVPQSIQVVVVAGGSLAVVPPEAAVGVGGTAQFTAVLRDMSNRIVTDRPVTWSSSNNATATISGTGVATGIAPGTVTITAGSEGRTATATLTVSAAGAASITLDPQQSTIGVGAVQVLTATVRDAAGNILPNRVVTFTSSNAAVAAIAGTTTNTVSVRGVAPGTATITASSEGRSTTATVTVSSTGSGSLSVTPNPVTLAVGTTVPLTTTVRDPAGNIVAGATILYSSANPAVAAVSSIGVITGYTPGTTTIAVTSGGQTINVPVTVTTTGAASVVVSPASPALSVGQAVQLTATVRDADGNVMSDRPVTWTSSNTQVATVSPGGIVTAVGPGTGTITAATSEGRSGTATVTVGGPATSSSLTLTPAQATIGVGGNVQLTATLRDANGNILTGRPVTFASSAPGVATVDANGRVTGVSAGTATIMATSDGHTATSAITVVARGVGSIGVTPASATTPKGGTVQLTAVVRDEDGNVLTDRPVTWTSGSAAVATVDANGLVTGTGPGTVTITATSEGKSGSSQITVTQAPVATITTTPTTASIPIGGTVQITATVRDENGNVLTDRPVTWVSSNPAVATVDGTGKVTGVATGAVTITATSEGKSASSTVTVTTPGPAPVSTVTITPTDPKPCVGQTTQLTATLRDAAGNILTGRDVTWTSTNTAIATVTSGGLVTGVAAGTATIIASAEGQAGTVSVTVCVAAVATLELAPASASVAVNGTVQLVATARDALGNVLTGRPVTFTTSNAAVATVDASGTVTGVAPGTATITATSEGQTATSVITVSPTPRAPVATIEIAPSAPVVCIGQSTQLTATLRDASGNILTGRDVTFTSANTAIATVTAGGLLTGVAAGTTTITATSEGKATSVTASICVAAVASITLAPATATIAVGATSKLTATVTDALGNVLAGEPVTFTSSNATVATVAADGTVLGLTPGTTTITATSGGKTATSLITVVLP